MSENVMFKVKYFHHRGNGKYRMKSDLFSVKYVEAVKVCVMCACKFSAAYNTNRAIK